MWLNSGEVDCRFCLMRSWMAIRSNRRMVCWVTIDEDLLFRLVGSGEETGQERWWEERESTCYEASETREECGWRRRLRWGWKFWKEQRGLWSGEVSPSSRFVASLLLCAQLYLCLCLSVCVCVCLWLSVFLCVNVCVCVSACVCVWVCFVFECMCLRLSEYMCL